MRALRAGSLPALTTLLGLLLIAPSADGRAIKRAGLLFELSVLNPEVRASLEEIKVLVLREDNLDLVWKLAYKPELADVAVVACSPSCHSSDVLEALASWAKDGRGLFIASSALFQASRYLLPESFFIEPTHLELPLGRSWLAVDSPLTENVQTVHRELWCSRDNTGSLKFRLRLDPDEAWPEELLTGPGEMLEPVLTWGRFQQRFQPLADPQALLSSRPILLATSYQGARVVWYAYDLDMKKKCRPVYDDVRLWSNLMHWLAGR